ncbi:MAG: 2-oxoacid:ferredoxin oxidoreductase subunit gamma [Clostridiales bacterium]|nr:2-oxoacid:ferredoxin oxidoreductase subunit gamma [Clostridiales bacterium]
MNLQMIFAGFGGQGVLLMGQLIAYAGMLSGKEVSWMPAYGPEMRGGSANCSVVVSDEPVGSPKVEDADVVVAMNKPSMAAFEKSVVPGGLLIYNSSLIDDKPARTDIRSVPIPVSGISAELGSPKVANMVMLGAVAKLTGAFSAEELVDALRHKLGGAKEGMMKMNREAIDRGMAVAEG